MVTRNTFRVISVVALASFALTPAYALAHCDGLDGPVVKAAQRALETRSPALALMWVQEKDAEEIQTAFEQTLAVRELIPQAKELADRFFFETLVRVHRAGEGAHSSRLRRADPAAAHRTLDDRLREHFGEVMATKTFDSDDLAAGRAYVKAYVEFIHFAERLYDSTMQAPHGHFEESDVPSKDH